MARRVTEICVTKIPYRFTVIKFVPDSFRNEPSNLGIFF